MISRRSPRIRRRSFSGWTQLARVEGQTTGTAAETPANQAEPNITDIEVQARRDAFAHNVKDYLQAGYSVIGSQEIFLGPGQRAGAYLPRTLDQFQHIYSRQRGGAAVATRYDASGDPVAIAYLTLGYDWQSGQPWLAKGGGGGSQAYHQAQYDPSKAADVLKARFVDRSSAMGIDLQAGSVSYVSPAAITVGQGDFPYSLSAQLIWRGGQRVDTTFGPLQHIQPQAPWTTNWNNSLNLSGSGLEALGQTDVRAMAGSLAAFVALQDLYKSAPSLQRDVTAPLIEAWWVRQLAGNVATVSLGAHSRQFFRRYDNTWVSLGAGPVSQLSQNQERAVVARHSCPMTPYVSTRGYDPTGVTFLVTGPNGDIQTYQGWSMGVKDDGSITCARQQGFRLTTWTWPKGVTVTVGYTTPDPVLKPAPRLASVSNNLGRTINFFNSGAEGFDNGLSGADRRVVTVVSPLGGQTTHTDPANYTTAFDVSLVGDTYRLMNVYAADDSGQPAISYTYDALGRVQFARDKLAVQGKRNAYEFLLAAGMRGERIDPAGGRYSVDYDLNHRPVRFIDELGRITFAAYDGRGRVSAYTYPELDQEQLSYDDRNQVLSFTKFAKPGSAQAGAQISMHATWDATWNRIASLTDAKNQTTDFTYVPLGSNGAGEMQTASRPAPTSGAPRPVYQFAYNSFGQLQQSTDPTGVVTAYGYDSSNFLHTVTLDPGSSPHVNAITTYTNNALGDAISIDGPRMDVADISQTFYDPNRRKTLEVAPDTGNPVGATATKTTYDALGRPSLLEKGYYGPSASPTFHSSIATAIGYDPVGNKSRETTPATVTQFSYDPLNRLVCTAQRATLPATLLDEQACQLSAQGSAGPDHITRNDYDAAGELTDVSLGVGTDAETRFAHYVYSANGQRQFVVDGNCNVTKLDYDGFDRVSRQYFPLIVRAAGCSHGGAAAIDLTRFDPNVFEDYGYDANGNRTRLVKRDRTEIDFAYDALDRSIQKTVLSNAAENVYYAYDLAGRMLSARYDNATTGKGIVFGYDSAGRQHTETSYNWTVTTDLDAAGNRIRLTWPDNGNQAVEYVYDAAGRLTKIREPDATQGVGVLAQFQYDELGRRTHIIRGNGGHADYDYNDPIGRLSGLTQAGASGQPASIQTMSYTPIGQLASLTQATSNYVWQGHPTTLQALSYNGLNQEATIASTQRGYDANGNMIDNGFRAYKYNADNRMILSGDGTNGVSIAYDPLGRIRATLTNAGVWNFFLYSGEQLIGEYADKLPTQPSLRKYVHADGIDEPIVWYEGGGYFGRSWLHADRQGSIIGWSDESGVVSVRNYGPYGEPSDWSGQGRFRYTGQLVLPEAQVYYYKARLYDPAAGRFLQTDPVGYDAGPNLYQYVEDDPTNKTDSAGLSPDGTSPIDPEQFRDSIAGGQAIISAAANHPGETLQIVGAAISLIPTPQTKAIGGAVSGAGTIVKGSTLKPGPFARESTPATGPGRITPGQQAEVNRIGSESGCHTCGTTNPGTKSGNFVGDHQPPSALAKPGEQQQLYPHCLSCSRQQGGQVRQAVEAQKPSPPPLPRRPDEP